jgi:hypothetical protein
MDSFDPYRKKRGGDVLLDGKNTSSISSLSLNLFS